MKYMTTLALLTCSTLCCFQTQAVIVNGGFETGTLNNWTLEVAGGAYWRVIRGADPDQDDAEFVSAAYPFEAATNPFLASRASVRTAFEGYTPVEGAHMAVIDHKQFSAAPLELFPDSVFVGPDGFEYLFVPALYTVSLTQSLSLREGDEVSGWAAMMSWDLPELGSDHAWVAIDGQHIWFMSLEDLFATLPFPDFPPASSPWQSWSWIAPADGVYTLSLNVFGDEQQDTAAFFDGIAVRRQVPVPEGWPQLAGIWLLAGAVGAGEFFRRRVTKPSPGSKRF